MRNRRLLLAVMSLLLAFYALVMSRFLPSSLFLIVFFCWLWVGVSALVDRLDAARAMATTMIVILLVMSLVVKTTVLGRGDTTAFFSLAMFPTLIAWGCVYVYVRYLQRAEDVTGKALNAWIHDREAEGLGRIEESRELGQQFSADMIREVSHDNSSSQDWDGRRRQPKLTVAG